MNMNDFRARAYGGYKKPLDSDDDEKSEKVSENKVIKPFIPQKISTADNVVNEEKKVQKFVPKTFITGKNSSAGVENKAGNKAGKITSEKDKENENKKIAEALKAVNAAKADQQLENATEYLKTGGLLKVPLSRQNEEGKDSVYRRVAKFLILIGEEEAAKILPHLPDKQIEKIIPEIASIRGVSDEEAKDIFAEFNALFETAKNSGGVGTARDMLEKAYGKDRAERMLQKAIPNEGKIPFAYLNDEENEKIYGLLKDENTGIKTLVLSNIEPKKAAAVINLMKADEKKEVALRLARMESVSPDIVARVSAAMKDKCDNYSVEKSENIDGRNALAQILKKMDVNTEQDILSSLESDDPDLGVDLRERLFTLDDVIKADDRAVQNKLHDMSEVEIAYLIAGKKEDFRNKILSNISEGRKREVLDQEDILKPMRKTDCDSITQSFVAYLRNSFEEGNLIIKDRNDETFVK